MSTLLTSAAAVIDALGGNQSVQELTQARFPQTVSNWRVADRFPSHVYLVMTSALALKGKSAPASLWGMTQAAQERSTATQQGMPS